MKIKLPALVLLCILCSFTPREITWTAIGDSITYLNDHQNETGNRITEGYMTRVMEKMPAVNYINQGHNGWTAQGIAKEIENLGLKKSDVYSVFLGTNDWWSGVPLGKMDNYLHATGPATLYGAYRVIINKIRSLNPEAKIILITPMQRSDFVYIADAHNNAWGSYKAKDGQQLSQFASAVREIGRHENCRVIDLYHNRSLEVSKLVKFKRLKDPSTGIYKNYTYPKYTRIPFDPDNDDYPYPLDAVNYAVDGLHPSDKGYQVIADLLVKEFRRFKN